MLMMEDDVGSEQSALSIIDGGVVGALSVDEYRVAEEK